MTTAENRLGILRGLGWMLNEELLVLPGVLRALVLSADGLPVTCSKDIDRSQEMPSDIAERMAAAVTGLQAVSQESTEFASTPRRSEEEPFSPPAPGRGPCSSSTRPTSRSSPPTSAPT